MSVSRNFWSWRRAWSRLLAMALGMAVMAAAASPPDAEDLITISGTGHHVVNTGKGNLEVAVRVGTSTLWRGRLHQSWMPPGFAKDMVGETLVLKVGRDPVFHSERIYGAVMHRRVQVDLDQSLANQRRTFRLVTLFSTLLALSALFVGWLTWTYPSLRTL